MKISTKGTSRFLSQEDIPAPFVAIIQDVRVENLKSNRGEENKYILYFTAGKPMVFNVVNRKTIVASYGDDSAQWVGRAVEIYVDPNVWMGSEQTGGIRVRIPAPGSMPPHAPQGTHRQVAAVAQPATIAPPNVTPTHPIEPARYDNGMGVKLTLAELSKDLVAGFEAARNAANANAWAKWGKQYNFTQQQQDFHEDKFMVALDRIAAMTQAHSGRVMHPAGSA